jgi:hypothetical protein
MRYLIKRWTFEPAFAFKVASSKNKEELAELLKSTDVLVSDIVYLIDFANFTTALSGFELTDRVEEARKNKVS